MPPMENSDVWMILWLMMIHGPSATLVGTQHWVTGKKVLVCPDWIQKVDVAERIFLNLQREKLQSGPEFDPSVPISRDYEEELFEYFGCRKYWI